MSAKVYGNLAPGETALYDGDSVWRPVSSCDGFEFQQLPTGALRVRFAADGVHVSVDGGETWDALADMVRR